MDCNQRNGCKKLATHRVTTLYPDGTVLVREICLYHAMAAVLAVAIEQPTWTVQITGLQPSEVL